MSWYLAAKDLLKLIFLGASPGGGDSLARYRAANGKSECPHDISIINSIITLGTSFLEVNC